MNFTKTKLVSWALSLLFMSSSTVFGQVNSGARYNKSNHNKHIIGYFTNWDAWKAVPGVVPKAGYNQLNIDFSQYTILNWSFLGVAKDGSLHSGDLRNKMIYQQSAVQEPGPMFWDDIYSSYDLWLLYGELNVIHYLADDLDKKPSDALYYVYSEHGYKGHNAGWINVKTGKTGAYPVSVPKKNSQHKGLFELARANNVKVMASIGGWSMCKHFPDVAADPTKRARFVRDCKELIDMGFDGIDIDWEFPGVEGMNFTGTAADYRNFTLLMQDIRAAIGPNKLLTAAFAQVGSKLQPFEWGKLDQVMDLFNFMSYDFGGGWNNKANHNSPLYNYAQDEFGSGSCDAMIKDLKSFGVNMSKVALGVGFYGRGVVTQGPASLGAPTVKVNTTVQPDGPVSTAADYVHWKPWEGTPNYSAVMHEINKGGWTKHWDDVAKVPYATKGNYFVSYDDERSVGLKAEYINANHLAGTIVWQVWGDMMNMEDGATPIANGKFTSSPKTKPVLANKLNEVFALGTTNSGGGGGTVTPPPVDPPPVDPTPPPTGSGNLGGILTKQLYEELFPYRNGIVQQGGQWVRTSDFFSYDKFLEAVQKMSNIEVRMDRRCATNAYKVTRRDKTTNVQTVIREDVEFKSSSATIITETVDYAEFANWGSDVVRKRELMAFFANISQETTGGWATAPGGQYSWGLYFKEEVGYNDASSGGYVEQGHPLYPPTAGKSYHGRGPIQLSWNYNYGQVSEFLYGDKTILLNNPERVAQDGALAFQTAIWFWMTPQYPKVSCHQAITGRWEPTVDQRGKGLIPGFGATVNIINGGLECSSGTENPKVVNRIGHYDRYAKIANVSKALDGTNSTIELGCAKMAQFQIDWSECGSSGHTGGGGTGGGPTDGGGNTGGGETGVVKCGAGEWAATKTYNTGNKVYYDGYTYEANFWTQGDRPDLNFAEYGKPWKNRVACTEGGTGGGETGGGTVTPPENVAPTVSITSPANGTTVNVTSVAVQAAASDSDGSIARVEFLLNGAVKHTATAAPYSTTLSGLVNGNNTVIAKAYDNSGATATAAISVNYTQPTTGGGGGGTGSGDCKGVAPWSSTQVYNTGDQARDGDIIYKANYWTQNNKPSGNQGSGKPWTVVSKCDGSLDASAFGETMNCGGKPVLVWKADQVYDKAGTEVYHQGKIYTAKYWTQGNTPGSADVWQLKGDCN